MNGIRFIVNGARRCFLPSKKVFFLHIAKCGGISINRALRYRYIGGYERLNAKASVNAAINMGGLASAFDDEYESVLRLREHLLLYFLHEGHAFVSGHYSFSKKAYDRFHGEYVFFTLLRNPVDRFFSSYFFNVRKRDDSPWKINQSLEKFIETREAKNLGSDYVRLLGGLREDRTYDSEEAIVAATRNLGRFDLVAVIEYPNQIERAIREVLGIRINVGHKNKNPVNSTERKNVISDSIRERVERLCEPDMKIYLAANELNRKRSGEHGVKAEV